MKFSIINASPNEELSERDRKKGIASFPPLGALYLASVLREEGTEVSVLDQPAMGLTLAETVKWVKRENPDVLGFSTFASSGRTAAMISNEVKRLDPDITTIFGGFYATFNAERILAKYPSVDLIVRGEGEQTIIELVKNLREGKLRRIKGLTFRGANGIVSTPDRPLMENLDSIPFPDRELLDVEYHSIIAETNVAARKFTSIVSSRGCVYRCRFCSCQRFARGKWRPRSVENTMKELHHLAGEGYQQLIFVDDSFTMNRKRVLELCHRMKKEKLDFEWICEGRVDNCSYEIFRELARAGCKIIYFGIESANQRILDYYGKQITPDQSRRAVELARKAGIDVIVGSFIVGAPDETRGEISNTLKFAKEVSIDIPQMNVLGVYPGMDIWREMKAKEHLAEDMHWETGVFVSEICPTAVPIDEIRQMIHEAFYDFIIRPSFLLKQVARTLGSSYRQRVVLSNLARVRSIRDGIRGLA